MGITVSMTTTEGVRRTVRCAALLAVTLVVAGCNGGTVDRHALANDGDAVDSLACEGVLLAGDVASGDSTGVFARVHAGALARRASNFADALSERPTVDQIEPQVRALARRSGRIATLLERLHDEPTDRSAARQLVDELSREGECR
jgi:hypothetical protein